MPPIDSPVPGKNLVRVVAMDNNFTPGGDVVAMEWRNRSLAF